jgi:hypothetical protein
VTLPTADVTYSELSAEITVQIPDDAIISALLGVALHELDASLPKAAAVKPDTVKASDARAGIRSDRSPIIP